MSPFSWPLLIGALPLLAFIAHFSAKAMLRAAGAPCGACLRRVPRGNAWCPKCGTNVTARTDLGR